MNLDQCFGDTNPNSYCEFCAEEAQRELGISEHHFHAHAPPRDLLCDYVIPFREAKEDNNRGGGVQQPDPCGGRAFPAEPFRILRRCGYGRERGR